MDLGASSASVFNFAQTPHALMFSVRNACVVQYRLPTFGQNPLATLAGVFFVLLCNAISACRINTLRKSTGRPTDLKVARLAQQLLGQDVQEIDGWLWAHPGLSFSDTTQS